MLEVRNVTKIFDQDMAREDWKIALDNLNLKVEDSEFITLIGGNGSGKSTLFSLISGSDSITSGQILIDGEDISKIKSRLLSEKVSMVFQDPKLGTASNMSIIENMELAFIRGEKRGISWGFKKEHEKIFKEELAKFDLGLENRLDQKVRALSGGQRQALTLLMATMKKPKILLLDEHTAALDPKTAKKVLSLTEKVVNENHLTTIMVTHNMKDAILYGNRLIMMHNGHIVFDCKGEDKKNLTVEQLYAKFEEAENGTKEA